MIDKLKAYWLSRDSREQMLLAACSALVLLAILYAAWAPLSNERERLQRRLPQLQQDVAKMQTLVSRWQAVGGGSTQQDWRNAAQARLAMHGLQGPQSRMLGSTTDGQQWQFERVPFNSFLDWLTALYNEFGVRVKNISVTPVGAGVVTVKVELTHL